MECTMDASSGPSHLGRQGPSVDDRNVDNDSLNEIEEIVPSTSVDALQSSPSSSNIPSESGQTHRTWSNSPRNPLKTQIFLSHSGAQKKPFVEDLNNDLRQEGYRTFFDAETLLKGKRFPEHIFKAARECDVAVVVLSREYLLSRWPMMELAAFVDAKKSGNKKLEILPLFYKLEVSAIKHDEELRRKMSDTWTTFAKDDRIKLKEWEEALDILPGINGEVFDNVSEDDYRKAIVKSIYNLCLPPVEFSLTNMEGEERLCSLVEGELEKKLEEGKTAILGRHGMGGLGKTMLCQALCMHFRRKFDGRVCYVDFGSKNALEMKKEILKRLTDLRSELRLNQLRVEQEVDDALRHYLPQQDVFLAIDNVPTKFATEDMACIFEFLSKGSMCIVTARSPETLVNMHELLEAANIKPLPSLTEEEAMKFFLHVALPDRPLSSLSSEQMEIVRTCVNRCVLDRSKSLFFAEFRVPADTAYHPITVKALANSMKKANSMKRDKSLDPLEWAREQKISEKLNADDMGSIYEIIEKLYMALKDDEKVLFMDVAVFAPREKLFDRDNLLKWLEGVHDMDKMALYRKLKGFEALSFLEISEDCVKMHDFYIDFAYYQLQNGCESIRKRCVFKAEGDALPLSLEKTPIVSWEDLERVKLQASSNHSTLGRIRYVENNPFYGFPGQKLREWRNLVVLHLEFGGEHIDIGPLKCLRALHLEADHNLKTFTCTNPLQQLQFVKFQCVLGLVKEVPTLTSTRLQELEMMVCMVFLPKAVTLPPASASLTVLRLSQWYSGRRHHDLNLGVFPNLTVVMIESGNYFHSFTGGELTISGLSKLTKLKELGLRKLPVVGPLLGLENMIGLETMTLQGCWKITSLPGLGSLTNLVALSLSLTAVEELPGVEKLLKLQELHCMGCLGLRRLPDLRSFPDLHVVTVIGCTLLKDVSASESCTVVDQDIKSGDITDFKGYVGFARSAVDDAVMSMEVARGHGAIANSSVNDANADHITGQAKAVGTDAGLSSGLGFFGPERRLIARLPVYSSVSSLSRFNDAESMTDRTRKLVNLQLDELEKVENHPSIFARKYATLMRLLKDTAWHSWGNLSTVKKVGTVILGSLVCVTLGALMALIGAMLGPLSFGLLGGVLCIFQACMVTVRSFGEDVAGDFWDSLFIVDKVLVVIGLSLLCVISGALMALMRAVLGPVNIVILVGVLGILEVCAEAIRLVGKAGVRNIWGTLSIVEKVKDGIFWSWICVIVGALRGIVLLFVISFILGIFFVRLIFTILGIFIGLGGFVIRLAFGILVIIFGLFLVCLIYFVRYLILAPIVFLATTSGKIVRMCWGIINPIQWIRRFTLRRHDTGLHRVFLV